MESKLQRMTSSSQSDKSPNEFMAKRISLAEVLLCILRSENWDASVENSTDETETLRHNIFAKTGCGSCS